MSTFTLFRVVAQRLRAHLHDSRAHVYRLLLAYFDKYGKFISGEGTRDAPWLVILVRDEQGHRLHGLPGCSFFVEKGKLYFVPLRDRKRRVENAEFVCDVADFTSFDEILTPYQSEPPFNTSDPRKQRNYQEKDS